MKSFSKRLLFNFCYFGLWVFYFVICRFIFLLYYADESSKLDATTLLQIPIQGLKLDFAFAAYLSMIPFLLMALSIWMPYRTTKSIIKWFSWAIIPLINALMLFDLALYGSWGIRLDATPLIYLNTPKAMFASITNSQLILAIVIWVIGSVLCMILFKKTLNSSVFQWKKGGLIQMPILLLLTASLVIIMRGGLQIIPINQSSVYFSDKIFANHAAINFAWSFAKSVIDKNHNKRNTYKVMDPNIAKAIIEDSKAPLIIENSTFENDSIINTKKPNIILLIWESLTAKSVGALGAQPSATPNFDQLAKEGILFNNFYANGDRSDRGLISILSGYIPQPNGHSIMKMPNKTQSLPMLTKKVADLGYSTAFYYAGDLGFGNMNTYFRNGGVADLIGGNEFNKADWNSKWGVHDHVMLNRLAQDIEGPQPNPFFKIAFTLSSHEPFEFPGTYKFGDATITDKFQSAHAYTDQSIADFIQQAKKQPWWDETLIIIMADHGHTLPKHEGAFNSPKKFHIPMLWVGGALAKTDTVISNFGSQIDFPYTLLSVLGGDNGGFKWSQNILNESNKHFAHYIFKNGFGILNDSSAIVYDYTTQKPIMTKGIINDSLLNLGKALTQDAYQDFLDR